MFHLNWDQVFHTGLVKVLHLLIRTRGAPGVSRHGIVLAALILGVPQPLGTLPPCHAPPPTSPSSTSGLWGPFLPSPPLPHRLWPVSAMLPALCLAQRLPIRLHQLHGTLRPRPNCQVHVLPSHSAPKQLPRAHVSIPDQLSHSTLPSPACLGARAVLQRGRESGDPLQVGGASSIHCLQRDCRRVGYVLQKGASLRRQTEHMEQSRTK